MAPLEPRATIYVMPGSQYSAKVVAALDSRGIPHYCTFVAAVPAKRKLPSGGTCVPEALIGDEVVPDSDVILRHYDEHHGTGFFPDEAATALTHRLSYGILAGAVLFYNWVHWSSYDRSMRKMFASMLPSYVCGVLRGPAVDYLASDVRANYRVKAAQQMGDLADETLNDEPAIRVMLIEELVSVQALLATPDQAQLFASAKQPGAADFSLYAMLERLIGDMGDASVPSALPDLAGARESQHVL